MKKNVIVVAGGSGSRMKNALPKQFLPVGGLPVLMHTLTAFNQYERGIRLIVALHPDFSDYWKELCRKHDFLLPHEIVPGGATRFESVSNALAVADDDCIIGIHDAVRPFADQATIHEAFLAAETFGAAVPVVVPKDSLRKLIPEDSQPVDRSDFRIVQTPQCFRSELIKRAYSLPRRDHYTDDATVVSEAGIPVVLTPGNPENIKITDPVDLLFAEALLKKS